MGLGGGTCSVLAKCARIRVCLVCVQRVHVSTCAASRNLPQPRRFMTYAGDFLRSCCEPHNNYYLLKVNSPQFPEKDIEVFGALEIHN